MMRRKATLLLLFLLVLVYFQLPTSTWSLISNDFVGGGFGGHGSGHGDPTPIGRPCRSCKPPGLLAGNRKVP